MTRRGPIALLALLALLSPLAACGSDDDSASDPGSSDGAGTEVSDDAELAATVEHYADGVHASYEATLTSATAMDEAIDAFLAEPSEASLTAARDAWLAARDDYGVTEAFRFYGGPIDDDDGPRGPDQRLADGRGLRRLRRGRSRPPGSSTTPTTYPEITADAAGRRSTRTGGETNISTGWHAIEFLLWGQDLSDDGPGDRPVTDYTDRARTPSGAAPT